MPTPRILYEFGSFRLDATDGVLLHDDQPVPLTQKQTETLIVLVQNSGRLVKKDELIDKVWADACVEPANLTQNIFILRKILARYDPAVQFIETAPRRGYRFVGAVREITADSSPAPIEYLSNTSREADAERDQFEEFNSLAVLPFINATADPDAEYLSDGLTESIINSLAHVQTLRVLSRNTIARYKGKEIDPREIGQELAVRSVLTGRILQLGDRLIIRTEVVDVKGGWQIWGAQYHRKQSDILAIQEEIAQEISDKLKLKLTTSEKRKLTKRYTDSSEAYHFYLKGRYHWNKYAQKGLYQAIQCFKDAIDADPTYALAYAGLADSYQRISNLYVPTREAMPKAKQAALKALEIDDSLAEAHAALGLVAMHYDWDWPLAEREFTRAIELNPNYELAHQRLALYFNIFGRTKEAMKELQIAIELDPLSLQISQSLAFQFFLQAEYDDAIEQAAKTLEMNPNYHISHYLLGWVYKRLGDLSKSLESFQTAAAIDDASLFHAAVAHAHGLKGNHTAAREILARLEQQGKERFFSTYCRAMVYIGLNEKDEAFHWLEEAFEERSEMLTWLRVGAEFDELRSDARFPELLRRIGLHRDYFDLKYAAS